VIHSKCLFQKACLPSKLMEISTFSI